MPGKPPLELSVEITDASGTTYRWDSKARAEDRPQGLSFGTKTGDGFGPGGCTLARRVDEDYNDIGLKNDVRFIGADGSIAYEGRVAATPRSYDESGHSISISAAGWMSYAKQQKFTMPVVDRDLGNWTAIPIQRQASRLAANFRLTGFEVRPDSYSNLVSIVETIDLKGGAKPLSEAWYDASGQAKVSAVYYNVFCDSSANVTTADANWGVELRASTDEALSSIETSSNFVPAGAGSAFSGYFTPTTARRYILASFYYNATTASSAGFERVCNWRQLAVYGNHGLTRRGTDPGGFYASDVIEWIAQTYCPKLSTAGVQDTTYPIPHLVFDRAFPFDAFLECNKYHGWDLGVWENRTLTFRPYDLTDYDWEIRLDDPGVQIEFQGDTTQDFFNGIAVTYQDVDTGRTKVLTPDDDSTLADTSVSNPANMWGEDQWDEATLSAPTDAAGAAQIGRMILAEKNAPKAPGQYRVTGHIKDRAGHWQPVWKVRAGDTVAITSSTSLSDRPHLIVETAYDHESYTVTIGVDNTLVRVDAILDRLSTALAANNLN